MRLASLVVVLSAVVAAVPVLADEPAPATSVVVLRGSSAPPTPWYEPPPEPQVIIQPVYVPLYYLPVAYGLTFNRQPHWSSARRNR
jgi:hypothetical protein